MNRVVCTAQQNGISIFYTDTDSIHILESDIDRLAEIFKNKYGKQLIGKELTQFHTDFTPISGKPSHSTCLIALGKKSYIDILRNEDGEVSEHIRMKGIPEPVIRKYCEKNQISARELYEQLYNGECITFDLTQGKICFKKTKCYEQISLKSFNRRIQFGQSP
jgi:hypothetical protein